MPWIIYGASINGIDKVLFELKSLQFEEAGVSIQLIKDAGLRNELIKLNGLMFYAGQRDSTYFKSPSPYSDSDIKSAVKMLNRGYFELYYHKTKGEAFKYFYRALELSKKSGSISLQKVCLLGVLKYYHTEIAQDSQEQERYLREYRDLRSDEIDDIWISLYGMIFYSKSLVKLNPHYYVLADELGRYVNNLNPNSSLLPKIYFELGLSLELRNEFKAADGYYEKAYVGAGVLPFLRDIRFFSLIHRSSIAQREKKFDDAIAFINKAKAQIDLADTLRSNYYINLYSSLYYDDLKKYDVAYSLLKRAYVADFSLNYRKSSLEINRLNVLLKTQEKQLENVKLKQNKTWLIVALAIFSLLLVLSYLAYKNIKAKKKIMEKEKEVQNQRMEKLLKDQELMGIDAMIEGQEKERQLIANDLHDNLGSVLTAVKFHFENLKNNQNFSDIERQLLLNTTDDLLEEAYQKVRGIAHSKNIGVNAQEGLLPAVRSFVTKVSFLKTLELQMENHGMDRRLENALEITIFRIIQELITNVIKHAHATEATIHLTQHEDRINIMVEDNGIGIGIEKVRSNEGMGLHSIQKRIENLGGNVTIDSILQKGTTIILDIPII